MSWASGSSLMSDVIVALHDRVTPRKRVNIYKQLIYAFEEHDCDMLNECRGLDAAFDRALDACGYGEDE